jgi:predicted membrane chloride channel (bestrophin family)
MDQQMLQQAIAEEELLRQIKEHEDAQATPPEGRGLVGVEPILQQAIAEEELRQIKEREDVSKEEEENAKLLATEYSRYLKPARRLSSSDWLDVLLALPRSLVLRQIRHPLLCVTGVSFLISFAHCVLGMPPLPTLSAHTLLGSGLSLLLVFRTNSAYQRFQEGRKIWNDILDLCRDIALSVALYRKDAGSTKIQTIRTSLQAFPFAMQRHVRSRDANEIKPRLQSLLDQLQQTKKEPKEGDAWNTELAASVSGYFTPRINNRPLQIIHRMLKTIRSIKNSKDDVFTNRERVWLLNMVIQLSHTVGRCERLVQTPVPMSYARHTMRFVSAWTLTLPLALVGNLRWLTVPVVFIITWALFGILEIGHSIEDPFRDTIAITPICEAIYHDCARALPARRTMSYTQLDQKPKSIS